MNLLKNTKYINFSLSLIFLLILLLSLPFLNLFLHKLNTKYYNQEQKKPVNFKFLNKELKTFSIKEINQCKEECQPWKNSLSKQEIKSLNKSLKEKHKTANTINSFNIKENISTLYISKGNQSFIYRYKINKKSIEPLSYSNTSIGQALLLLIAYTVFLYFIKRIIGRKISYTLSNKKIRPPPKI